MNKSGKYIFRVRKTTTLSQDKFAEKLGFTRGYISQLENDSVDISLSKFITWCDIFKVEPKDILNEDNW